MQGIFRKENTDKALKYGIYRHLPTYEKIIRNLVSFYNKNDHIGFQNFRNPFSGRYQKQHSNDNKVIIRICFLTVYHLFASIHIFLNPPFH